MTGHRFAWTFADTLVASAARKTTMVETETQQLQPGTAAVQMMPQSQAGAHP